MKREVINYLVLICCLVFILVIGLGIRDIMNERIDDKESDILINYEAEIYGVEIYLSVTKEEK